MLLKDAAANRALAAPDAAIRLFVLAGPDEAASRAMAESFAAAMGTDAERIDLSARAIKDSPSILSDEVAAFSLFGTRRWIRVDLGAASGDDWLPAAEAVLASNGGNPVLMLGSGLSAKSKLVKLAEKHTAAITTISYLLDGAKADALARSIGEQHGLSLSRETARALADATGGDRALMARECEKLALYLDVDAGADRRVEHEDWLAIGAATPEEDIGAAVNIILGGRTAALPALFSEIASLGTSEVRLVRALAQRALLLARLRARMAEERVPARMLVDGDKAIFWKERDAVARQLDLWKPEIIARLIDRLHGLERALKQSGADPALTLRDAMLWICRAAERAAAGAR